MGTLASIYTCPAAGANMHRVFEIEARAGVGLVGDRYAVGTDLGFYSNRGTPKIRHVSIITVASIFEAQRIMSITAAHTRRNLVFRDVDLAALEGREFQVGPVVRMRWVEICKPCPRPSTLAHHTDANVFMAAFPGIKAGIRAEILNDGVIRFGDGVILL